MTYPISTCGPRLPKHGGRSRPLQRLVIRETPSGREGRGGKVEESKHGEEVTAPEALDHATPGREEDRQKKGGRWSGTVGVILGTVLGGMLGGRLLSKKEEVVPFINLSFLGGGVCYQNERGRPYCHTL